MLSMVGWRSRSSSEAWVEEVMCEIWEDGVGLVVVGGFGFDFGFV